MHENGNPPPEIIPTEDKAGGPPMVPRGGHQESPTEIPFTDSGSEVHNEETLNAAKSEETRRALGEIARDHSEHEEIQDRDRRSGVTVPEGWKTNGGLARAVERSPATVAKAAMSYRKDHPDWFQSFTSQTGNRREFYSPELVES